MHVPNSPTASGLAGRFHRYVHFTTVLRPTEANEEEMVNTVEEQIDDVLEDDIVDKGYVG